MPLNSNELEYIIGDKNTILQMQELHAFRPFSDIVIDFLDDLSKRLMNRAKEYSDVMTFAFWCRKSAMLNEKAKYDDIETRLGRGMVFHSTPSNVPINFAFSLVSGLLAGNANIVRLPAKEYPQVDIISQTLDYLLNTNHKRLKPYLCLVKYQSKKEITDALSIICNSRIVWGGDKTIDNIRKSPLQARANEINFADRYSILVINSDAYLMVDDKEKITKDFYNDTYLSDQNACTSPRIIFWLGKNKEQAKSEFWSRIQDYIQQKYNLKAVQAVGKLHAMYKAATASFGTQKVATKDNLITRIQIKNLDKNIMNYKYNSGFFFEYDINNLEEINVIAQNRCQTMTYFGITKEEISELIEKSRPFGIDRFVPLGKSMDFSLNWDGYDLIRELSRKISIV